MSSAETLEELIAALHAHPDWRPKVLQALLTEEFLQLPARVMRLEEEVSELRVSTERGRQHLTESHRQLAESHRGLRGRIHGEQYEREKRKQGFYIFRGGEDATEEAMQALREATLDERVSRSEARDAARLDFVWEKKPRGESRPYLFVVGVSVTVDSRGVRRASARAKILARVLGDSHRVLPVVLGECFTGREAEEEARTLGVDWFLEVEGTDEDVSRGLKPLVESPPAPG